MNIPSSGQVRPRRQATNGRRKRLVEVDHRRIAGWFAFISCNQEVARGRREQKPDEGLVVLRLGDMNQDVEAHDEVGLQRAGPKVSDDQLRVGSPRPVQLNRTRRHIEPAIAREPHPVGCLTVVADQVGTRRARTIRCSLTSENQSSGGAVARCCDTERGQTERTVMESAGTGYELGSDAAELERLVSVLRTSTVPRSSRGSSGPSCH